MSQSPVDLVESSLLPASVATLATVIGWPNALLLIENYGGRVIAVNERAIYTLLLDLPRLIGKPSTDRLLRAYGGGNLYVPACAHLVRAERNRRIRATVQTLERSMSTRAAVTQMAREWRVTERTIWRALSPTSEATEVAPAIETLYQLPLL